MIRVIIGLFSGIFIFLLAVWATGPNSNSPRRSVPSFDPRYGQNGAGHLPVPSGPYDQQAGQFQVPVEQMVVLRVKFDPSGHRIEGVEVGTGTRSGSAAQNTRSETSGPIPVGESTPRSEPYIDVLAGKGGLLPGSMIGRGSKS